MTDPDFNICRQAEFPRFHHLSDSRLCLFLSKGGWQTPWNNPRTLTSARPTVTSQETNGWSKEGQRKLERQRDRKQVAVEQRRWGGRTVIELDSISCSFSWKVRRCRSGWEAPHASAENHISSAEGGEEYAIPVWLKTAACVVVWGCFRYSRQGGEHTHILVFQTQYLSQKNTSNIHGNKAESCAKSLKRHRQLAAMQSTPENMLSNIEKLLQPPVLPIYFLLRLTQNQLNKHQTH